MIKKYILKKGMVSLNFMKIMSKCTKNHNEKA